MADYSKFKVVELKELLNQRGIAPTGLTRKQQIIDALEEDDNNDIGASSDGDGDDVNAQVTKKRAPSPTNNGPTNPPKKKAKSAHAATPTPAPTAIKSAVESSTQKPKVAEAQFAKPSDQLNIPVDEGCHLAAYRVYVDPGNGIIYDASLNQTNASNNNNKFYRVQLLQGPRDFKTWTRWGRVGEHGQSAVLGNGSLADATKNFEKKFKDKSGLKWDDRGEDPKPGKYVFVERSYVPDEDEDDDDDDKAQADAGASGKTDTYTPPKCTLEPPVQSLMELIFNQQYFAAAMDSLNYDAQKLPLGKLSKATITRGFQALKDLSALFDDPSRASDYQLSAQEATEHLSNLYYSLIPHTFGRSRPPVIGNYDMLKKEIELLESLSDLKDADNIIKAGKDGANEVHQLDSRFKGLGMEEMSPLPTDGDEFSEISQYLLKTCGQTHNVSYTVQDIFRIERQGEQDRLQKTHERSDRRLLWHGSRATNFGGILGQGLRIAPPEAPVSGYMFDKGIYLADMSSKSANYCYPYISGGHALLLLCEAELGNPMLTLKHASYNAADEAKHMGALSTWGQGSTGPRDWKDAECVHPSLAGVMMPDTTLPPGKTDVKDPSLMYNEYICYNTSQVRLRYLLRVRM